MCNNLKLLCNLHKPPETLEERAERKSMYMLQLIRKAKGMASSKDYKEWSDKWEKANLIHIKL